MDPATCASAATARRLVCGVEPRSHRWLRLAAGDADGVDCDNCHKMTNPNNRAHLGVMKPPFIANDEQSPRHRLLRQRHGVAVRRQRQAGPYSDAAAKHQFMQSKFHRDVDFCGTCHDVSNPAVGDLAHNNGKQPTGDP
jgi:hypothetical protein